jgi:hypothetical protein
MTRPFSRFTVLSPLFIGLAVSSCDCGLEPLEQVPDPPPEQEIPEVKETGAVEGRVCSADGETWLAGALVTVQPVDAGPITTVSDLDGHFRLEQVPAGPQTVLIEKGSFSTTRDVVVQSGLTTTIPEDECQLDHPPRIAVVHGSQYDQVEGVLGELGVEVAAIDVYQSDWAEQLLSDDDGLANYDILFLNCRSNETTYVSRPDMQARLRAFVERGGSLHASDQAYDLIEVTFPEKINFLGDDLERGAGDQGDAVDLDATVLDPILAGNLGTSTVTIHFGLTTWSVMTGVASDVEIYMEGDAPLLDGGTINDAPLIVGFDHGEGRVVYSSFHQEPGIGQDQENVLKMIMFEL